MFFGGTKRKRSERLAGLVRVPGKWEVAWSRLRRTEVALRVIIGLTAATVLCVLTQAWNPPPLLRLHLELARDSMVGLPAGTLEWHRPLLPDNESPPQEEPEMATPRPLPKLALRFLGVWTLVVLGGRALYLHS